MAILRTEKAMMRAMYGVKIIEERRNQELMSSLGLKNTSDGLASTSGVRWYGRVLRRDNGDVLRRALDFEVAERRGRGRPSMTSKRQVEHTNQIGLKRKDAFDRVMWLNGVYELSRSTRRIRPPALTRTKSDLKNWISLFLSCTVPAEMTVYQCADVNGRFRKLSQLILVICWLKMAPNTITPLLITIFVLRIMQRPCLHRYIAPLNLFLLFELTFHGLVLLKYGYQMHQWGGPKQWNLH